jgi:hypothetical protein
MSLVLLGTAGMGTFRIDEYGGVNGLAYAR